MQEDKEAIFDAVDTLELCLKTVTPMLDTMKTIPANMRRAAAKGFINATDCADYLTKKGMPFRDAYKLTGCMVSDCIAKDKTLEELTLDEFKGYSALFENDIYDAIDLVKCCEGRTSYGGPSEASVNNQIALAAAQLNAWEAKERMSVKVFIDGSSGTTGPAHCRPSGTTPGDRAAFHFRRGPQGCERAREGDQLRRPRLPLPAGCRFQRGHAPAAPGREGAGHLHRLPHRCRMGLRLPGAGGPEGKNQKFLPRGSARLLCQRLYQHCPPAGGAGPCPAEYPFSCTGISGYSGGGKKMIAEYESPDRPAHSKLDAPKSYGLGLAHKHLPEMQKISGLAHTPPCSCRWCVTTTAACRCWCRWILTLAGSHRRTGGRRHCGIL